MDMQGKIKQYLTIFNNNELVTRLLLEIKNLAPNEKIRISQSLLLNVYDISNDEIKKDIHEYFLGIDINKDSESLTFDLLLFIRGLKEFDVSLVDHLDQYISKFDGTNQFSTILYTLKEQFKYLVHEMSDDNFLEL